MKKFVAVLLCIVFLASSLLLVSCQKKETVTEPEKAEEPAATGGYGEEPAATGGYGEEPEAPGGHGEEQPAEEKPAETGGY
jgi:hypothetical protein